MAPRKLAAAGGEDQLPTLKLNVEKGPLAGQTNEFRPGSKVQIGRVVRGNTLSIKDAGISSKHLLIQFESESDPGRRNWTITDLGSSNGTILNGVALEPLQPTVLSDGDAIKFGETTSMKVKLEASGDEEKGSSGMARRNATRRGRKRGGELGVIEEDSELGLGDSVVNAKLGCNDEEKEVRGRRTRGPKARDLQNQGEIAEGKMEGLRSIRSLKNEEIVEVPLTEPNEDEKISDNAGEEKGKGGRNMSRSRDRCLKDDEILVDDSNKIDEDYLGRPGLGGGQRVSTRRTRSSRKVEDFVDLSVIEGRRTRRGARAKKDLPAETPLEEEKQEESNLEGETCQGGIKESVVRDDEFLEEGVDAGRRNEEEKQEESNLEGETCQEGIKESVVRDDEFLEEGVDTGRRNDAGLASTSGVKEIPVEVGKGKVLADLEKMTLGEWFDFLEDFLPKQIIDATEEMISEMKQKAERLHEFKLQQMNAKEKGKMAVD